MDSVSLQLETRDTNIKAKNYLADDIIPVEFYGKGVKNRSLKVDYQTFRRLYNSAGGNTIVEVEVDGKDKMNALVHNVDYHPLTDRITHVELINVRMDQEITTSVDLEFVGVAPAVKELGGVLTTATTSIDVKCLPKNLIHGVEVDISSLVDFHTFVRIKDLIVPDTVEILNDPEDVVATCVAPREEEEVVVESEEGVEGAEGAAGESASDEKGEDGAKEGEGSE